MNIVIIGASHAGISAAVNLRKKLPDAKIILFEAGDGDGLSFVGADGLLWVSGDIAKEHMTYTTKEKIEKSGIGLNLSSKIEKIDFEKQEVYGESFSQKWDYLVLATGSSPIIPDFAKEKIKSEKDRIQTFKTIADARNLKKIVENEKIEKVGIIGGGYIGVETAETLVRCGKKVKIFHASSDLLGTYYDSAFSNLIRNQLEKNGVETELGKRFSSFEDEEAKDCDAFVLSLGFRANCELGEGEIEKTENAFAVDEFCETSRKNVFAIGDCAVSFNNAFEKKMFLAIGSGTARGASIVSDAIARRARSEFGAKTCELSKFELKSFGVSGANALQVFNLNLASCGATLKSALDSGFSAEAVDFQGDQLASYLKPRVSLEAERENADSARKAGAIDDLKIGEIKLRIVFDKENHRLLGAQVASFTDTVFANHVFSLAIQKRCTIEELLNFDMFFLPTLNQLYNALRRCLQRVL